MTTIALVGADGAGKTTIAQTLAQSFPRPIKYLYMGTSIQSSNVSLPTARLAWWLKQRAYRRQLQQTGQAVPTQIATHQVEQQGLSRGRLAKVARLAYRLTEEWFRQMVAWIYQLRGYLVLYDRHFFFEYLPSQQPTQLTWCDRLHRWHLQHCYPRPDLVIFLDAAPAILYSRKPEWDLAHLQQYRTGLLAQGQCVANFVQVDAAQPLEQVLAEVRALILQFCAP
jgi:thymidylate kinase